MTFTFRVILGVLLLTGCAWSQSKRPIYQFTTGIALPSQPKYFNQYWSGGWHANAYLGYPVLKWLTIGGAFGYSRMPLDAAAIKGRPSELLPVDRVTGDPTIVITAQLRAKANLVAVTDRTVLSPYFFGGIGWYRLSIGKFSERMEAPDFGYVIFHNVSQILFSGVGVEFGAGLEVRLTERWHLCMEIADSGSLTEHPIYAEWVPVRVGFIFQ